MTYSSKTSLFLFCILCASATMAGCGDDDDSSGTDTAGQGSGGDHATTAGTSAGGKAGGGSQAGSRNNTAGDMGEGGNVNQAGNENAGGQTTTNGGAVGAGGDEAAGGASSVKECTQLQYGPAVFAHYVTTAQPAAKGGNIVAGTYHLTALTHYGSIAASTSNDPIHSALKLTASGIEWANQAKQEDESRGTFTYTVNSTNLQLTNVCPVPGPGDATPFTAEGTTLILYLDAEYTYTKQ